MNEMVIGIVADTHVPDRLENLHPGLCAGFRSAGVAQILHAGDVCNQAVLDELSETAPVMAVQGNRDLLLNGNLLPKTQLFEVFGKKIGLLHGHGNMWLYVVEKFNFLLHGYQLSYYRKLAIKTFPDADVFVYGHTHKPENERFGNRLIFNPGSAGMGGWGYVPSYGIIRIAEDGTMRSEIIELSGAVIRNRRWTVILPPPLSNI